MASVIINADDIDSKTSRSETEKNLILSETLKMFYSKSNPTEKSPRKEYLRCCLFRRFFKLVKNVEKNKTKICFDPLFIRFCTTLFDFKEATLEIIDRKNLPYVENKTNVKFKSYNNYFCQELLENNIIRELFTIFVEMTFELNSIEDIGKELRVYCCKEECLNRDECKKKYSALKEAILLDLNLK